MPSLSQLLTSHGSLLVLDAASMNIQVGLLRHGSTDLWWSSQGESSAAIFSGAGSVLAQASMNVGAIEAFAFCEGPGSMLGIRTVAMALRTWQVLSPRPVYAFQSLAVAAHYERLRGNCRNFSVIADARRDSWHCQQMGANGSAGLLQRVPSAKLPDGELLTPEGFRAWAQPPRTIGFCSYGLASILPAIAGIDCFRLADTVDAFQHEPPDYRKSPAQVHRATATTLK